MDYDIGFMLEQLKKDNEGYNVLLARVMLGIEPPEVLEKMLAPKADQGK